MNKHSSSVFIAVALLCLLGVMVNKSRVAYSKFERTLAAKQATVEKLAAQTDQLRVSLVAKQSESQPIEAFLQTWAAEYDKHSGKLDTGLLRPLADRHRLIIAEYSSAPMKFKSDTLTIDCDRYTIRVLGGYSEVLRFLGDLELESGLAAVQNITLGRNINDVSMRIELLIPQLLTSTR